MELELYSFLVPDNNTSEIRILKVYHSSGLFVLKCASSIEDFSFRVEFPTLDKALAFARLYLLSELESLFN